MYCENSICPIKQESIADYATWKGNSYEEPMLPRQLDPFAARLHFLACGNGHLRCDYGPSVKSRPLVILDLPHYLDVLSLRAHGPLPQLSEGGSRVGFVSLRLPRFVPSELSLLDLSLLTPATFDLGRYGL